MANKGGEYNLQTIVVTNKKKHGTRRWRSRWTWYWKLSLDTARGSEDIIDTMMLKEAACWDVLRNHHNDSNADSKSNAMVKLVFFGVWTHPQRKGLEATGALCPCARWRSGTRRASGE